MAQSHKDILSSKDELETCRRILARRLSTLDIDRSRRDALDLVIRNNLEAILHVKRRIYELEKGDK